MVLLPHPFFAAPPPSVSAPVGCGDPYRDPYPAEAQLALGPLSQMRARVGELLRLFPRVTPLVVLERLCARIMGFAHTAPLGKVLLLAAPLTRCNCGDGGCVR